MPYHDFAIQSWYQSFQVGPKGPKESHRVLKNCLCSIEFLERTTNNYQQAVKTSCAQGQILYS